MKCAFKDKQRHEKKKTGIKSWRDDDNISNCLITKLLYFSGLISHLDAGFYGIFFAQKFKVLIN